MRRQLREHAQGTPALKVGQRETCPKVDKERAARKTLSGSERLCSHLQDWSFSHSTNVCLGRGDTEDRGQELFPHLGSLVT